MSSLTNTAAVPTIASRGRIVMMAIIAGTVITNLYCIQPILPLIAADMRMDLTTVNLVAGVALLGFATGLGLLLPLGDRYDRRKLILVQIALAFCFALTAALGHGIWNLAAVSFGLGAVACVPQQLVPFAAVMSAPAERGRSVGTVVSGIMLGILVGRTVSGVIGAACGWRAVYGVEAAFMIPVWIVAALALPRGVPVDPTAQGRINSLYMTATFCGGAVGVALSGWLMGLFGWAGVDALGITIALAAASIHVMANRQQAAATA